MQQPVLVLGAGLGKRMGGPKILLRHKNRLFLAYILARCVESNSPATVVAPVDLIEELGNLIVQSPGPLREGLYYTLPEPRWVPADGTQPMLASVQAGLAVGGWEEGFWVWPVDAPFLSTPGWERATEAVSRDPASIWKLKINDRTGHPTWFPSWSVSTIAKGDWPDGLLGFLGTVQKSIRHLTLENEEIGDFNTPEDLKRLEKKSVRVTP